MSSTVNDSGLRIDLPVSKTTPRKITGVRSGVNRIGHPLASTRMPGGVPGHLSLESSTPSPSESLKRWHPTLSTPTPCGVLGPLSMPSGTPAAPESKGQTLASAYAPAGGLRQAFGLAGTPSWSRAETTPPPVKRDSPSEPTTWLAQSAPANPVLGE